MICPPCLRASVVDCLLAALLVACSPAIRETPPTVAAQPVAPRSIPAPRPPRLNPRLTDPRWLLASSSAGDDPLEKARLAVSVGAAELLDGIADGGDTAATALAALPYADDADIALGRLAELARGDAASRRRVLLAILAIAGQPRRAREPLDPEGVSRCGELLLEMAADPALARDERSLAISAARALADKGALDPARAKKIPSDLDPTRGSLAR